MARPIINEYVSSKGILKFIPFEGAACVVPESMGVAQADGRKLVVAGTPFPANDATCLGLILDTVDVTNGDKPGTYVYEGVIDPDKLTANGVTVAAAAKAAMPRVTFYGEAH